ncbi:HAMP domain-containing sensor histidine kinase [Breznakiellaceae bacterium SP9]
MTLRRRLFISNIIMIALPLLLVWMLFAGVGIALYGLHRVDFDMLPAEEKQQMFDDWENNRRHISGIMMAIAIFIAAAVNQFLTRSIIKRVMKPLDALICGARQFSENNLGFRLDYCNNDEFRPVCDTFNEMAARLEKNENSRRELIVGISHDLRTPLTSIKMSIDGIKSGVAATAEQREKYAAIIENKTNDMEHIINQLFLFSKLDMDEFPAQTQIVNCGLMIEDCIEELSDEYERRGLSLIARDLPRDLHSSIDPLLFRRVIVNSFENAVKYKTAEKGQMVINAVKKTPIGEKESVEISLVDNGPGVAPENLEKLFDVFYRADQSRNKKGSGLGLAISAKIIAKMGGTIHAELPASGGLAIVIELPLVTKEEHNGK